ncbi:MAG: alanine dehydrogenase [Candidatus Methylomirabilis sp.]|nr:alanine dehydrogenase [Deltaproteobacteria bacterium]
MIIGVPKEIKVEENRVGLTPEGERAFKAHRHKVVVEKGAGRGSGFPDAEYKRAGATLASAKEVWTRADMIVKVKEPQKSEYRYLREGLIVYTYLHLAADVPLTRELMKRKVAAVGYETIQLPDGRLPLLTPMSEVAGRLSLQVGAHCLETRQGGRGVLISGVSGVRPAKVVIVGAGVAGANACHVAVGMGADVSVLDIQPSRLAYLSDIHRGSITTLMSNRANIEEEVTSADLVIGGVLIPGAKAPKLITRDMIKAMRPGAALVDIAVDQGGCAATTRATTHAEPTFIVEEVVHYCVANMPAIVPRTSTYALTNATLGYGLALADKGLDRAVEEDRALALGVNVRVGEAVHPGVAQALREAR